MAGINVLLDSLKGGNKLEKTSTQKGKDVIDSSENAAEVFAAMLSGSINPNADPKGQNSSIAGQESEEKQSAGNPVQSVQNSNEQGSMLGYGNIALSNLFEPMLQSDIPAGKEANSGNDVSQGNENSSTANSSLTDASVVSGNNLGLAMLNLVSLASDEVSAQSGMTTPKPQGDNPRITELDKYRQVIADLLVALSGEIKDLSPKVNSLSIKNFGLNDSSQDMVKVVQGWALTDDVAKDSYAPRVKATSSQTTGRVEAAKVPQEGSATTANLSSTQALNHSEASISELGAMGGVKTSSSKENPIRSESIEAKEPSQDMAKVGRGQMTLTNEVVKNANGSNVQATKGEATLRTVTAETFQEGRVETTKVLPEGSVTKANSSSTQALDHQEALISELRAMGEIKIFSPKENLVSLENTIKKDFSQDTAYGVQGQRLKTDDVAKDSYAPRVEVASSQTTGRVETTKGPQEESATRANSLTNQTLNHSEVLNILSAESIGTKDPSQDIVKVVQGQRTLTDDVVKNGNATSDQKGIQPLIDGLTTGFGNGNAVLNAKASTLQAALYPILRLEGEDLKESHGINETLEAEGNVTDVISKGRSKAFIKPLKGMEDDLFLRKFQRAFSREIPKEIDSAKSSETLGVKAPQNQNLSTGIGFVGNIVSVNSAETKTAAIPVWQQISNVFREQVLNRHQELKELDIQLHPADLGKIRINLRWENGQVHLQVQASEASTGQILQNQLSELRQTLSNQGVNCGMLQMGQGGGERQQNSRGYEQPRPLNPNPQLTEDGDVIQITNPLSLAQDVINRINVIA